MLGTSFSECMSDEYCGKYLVISFIFLGGLAGMFIGIYVQNIGIICGSIILIDLIGIYAWLACRDLEHMAAKKLAEKITAEEVKRKPRLSDLIMPKGIMRLAYHYGPGKAIFIRMVISIIFVLPLLYILSLIFGSMSWNAIIGLAVALFFVYRQQKRIISESLKIVKNEEDFGDI